MKQCGNVTPKSPPKFLRNLGGLTGQATNRGFTLIELLVVISIIVIFTGIVLVGYRTGEQQLALQRSANKLAQDIRKVQEMAMSAKGCEECGGGVPEDGYGIVFNSGNPGYCPGSEPICYILYAETGGDGDFYTPADTIVGPTLELEEGVFIADLFVDGFSHPKISINFKSPDPTIMIKYSSTSSPGGEAEIIIALETDTSKTKTIKVNKVGRIDID